MIFYVKWLAQTIIYWSYKCAKRLPNKPYQLNAWGLCLYRESNSSMYFKEPLALEKKTRPNDIITNYVESMMSLILTVIFPNRVSPFSIGKQTSQSFIKILRDLTLTQQNIRLGICHCMSKLFFGRYVLKYTVQTNLILVL